MIAQTGIKIFGCCRNMHSPIEAALQAGASEPYHLEKVDEIHIGLVGPGLELVAKLVDRKYEPKTRVDGQCPTKPLKRRPQRALRFSQQEVDLALRRKRNAEALTSGQNPRAAVVSTVRSVKHPFMNGKVPMRGRPRVCMVMIASAAMNQH